MLSVGGREDASARDPRTSVMPSRGYSPVALIAPYGESGAPKRQSDAVWTATINIMESCEVTAIESPLRRGSKGKGSRVEEREEGK